MDNLPAPSTTTPLRRLVEWGIDGTPTVVTVPMVTKAQLQSAILAAAALPYDGPDKDQFPGLTNAEVMVIKKVHMAAVTGECEDVLDRILGKPKTTAEITKMEVTYEEFLNEVARKADASPRNVTPSVDELFS